MLRPRCTWVHMGVGHVPSFPSPETSECLRLFRLRGSETLPPQDVLNLPLQAGSALHNLTCSHSEKGPPRWLATPQPILTLKGRHQVMVPDVGPARLERGGAWKTAQLDPAKRGSNPGSHPNGPGLWAGPRPSASGPVQTIHSSQKAEAAPIPISR